jgi:CheY-like chemotaxis protein
MLSPVPATQRIRQPAQKPIAGYEGRRRTILVADDDANHVGFLREALTRLGFVVVMAGTGTQCLDVARSCEPDAILLDVSMPGMNGWEAAQRLRESIGKRAAIVMISADARQESHREIAVGNHDAYLMKPLRLPALLDSLKQFLDLEWIYAEAPSPEVLSASLHELPKHTIPSKDHLARLHRLGEIGHVRGILAKLDEIGATQPAAAPTLAYLRRLAENCDLDKYKDTIEALTPHGV